MSKTVYRFSFSLDADATEAEATLHLALFAIEGLFGQARVRLDASYRLDTARQAIFVDATTGVGAALARTFTGLLLRELGDEGFEVRTVESEPSVAGEEKAA